MFWRRIDWADVCRPGWPAINGCEGLTARPGNSFIGTAVPILESQFGKGANLNEWKENVKPILLPMGKCGKKFCINTKTQRVTTASCAADVGGDILHLIDLE